MLKALAVLFPILIFGGGIFPAFGQMVDNNGTSVGMMTGNTIKVNGTDFSISYSITNGKIIGMQADTKFKSLIASVQTTGGGMLTITLPRALIDSKSHDKDSAYLVYTEGEEAEFQEITTTSTDRILSIPFGDGTHDIQIIGTQVIPEFGPTASLILVIALTSIIIISSKTRNFINL